LPEGRSWKKWKDLASSIVVNLPLLTGARECRDKSVLSEPEPSVKPRMADVHCLFLGADGDAPAVGVAVGDDRQMPTTHYPLQHSTCHHRNPRKCSFHASSMALFHCLECPKLD
jgi:hypothetical protein